jgi:hypothetical protein
MNQIDPMQIPFLSSQGLACVIRVWIPQNVSLLRI